MENVLNLSYIYFKKNNLEQNKDKRGVRVQKI